jgi:ubiquinone/menaquinone biosynthesis C-methylase UbiE
MIKNLSPKKWNKSFIGDSTVDNFIGMKKDNKWVIPILENTSKGNKVLELGSGSGVLSSILSEKGRKLTLVDFSEDNLDFSKTLFRKLDLKAEFIKSNVLNKFPFKNKSFDCVFSSGLLEHFNDKEIIKILKESKRVSRKLVISLMPNANSLPYHLGKLIQEKEGKWIYGKETPKTSMKELFEKAGLKIIEEYSIDPIFKEYNKLGESRIKLINQGYLLVTIGRIK